MIKKITDNIVEIISLDEFTSIVSNYEGKDNVFYRGQKNKGYDISCSLSREDGYVQNEKDMTFETIETKSKDFEAYKTPIEILSKMQHYGIPTRLVDVTLNPYIALYFAVEDSEHDVDAEVLVFEKKAGAINSRGVRLVSLLAISTDYSFKALIELYKSTYGEEITEDEIVAIIEEHQFVEFNEMLSNSNERLYNQEGTFILCTNVVENNTIQKQIRGIPKSEVSCSIRIPVEYKAKMKEELDVKYAINEHTIYPELNIFAKYIREKYKSNSAKNVNDYKYKIIEEDDISHALAKRLSLKIELERRISIEAIKAIIYNLVNEYKHKYDVIWIYVSSSKEDTITYNWTVRTLWIDSRLDRQSRPSASGKLEEDGMYWTYGRGITSTREFYEQNVFEEDSKLLELNYSELQNIKRVYNILKDVFKEMDINDFLSIVDDYKEEINEIYFRFQSFGLSRNSEVSKYLHIYQQIACDFHNITLVKDKYLLNRYFISLDKNIAEAEDKYQQYLLQS